MNIQNEDKNKMTDKLKFILAQANHLDEIFLLYTEAIKEMNANQIYQWDEMYPDKSILAEDIRKQEITVALLENEAASQKEIIAAYVLNQECDEEYQNGNWNYPNSWYYIIHRLCVNPKFQNQGIARRVMLHIEKELKKQGVESIRLDAFSKNLYALKLYKSLGYTIAGHADWRKGRFYLMEKSLD